METSKEKYIRETFEIIRNKNLSEPITIKPGEQIGDLEKFLESTQKSMMATDNKNILKLYIEKLKILQTL